MLPQIFKTAGKGKDWIFFVEDHTKVHLESVVKFLLTQNAEEPSFLARGLFDKDMTIIHHFSQRKSKSGGEFLYPDFDAGWLLSFPLLKLVATNVEGKKLKSDFQIDLKHEIAVYIADLGVELTHTPELCGAGEEGEKCITNVDKELPECGSEVGLDDIFVAVKTTYMFHKDRLKAVMDTWGPRWKHIVMYSNVTDPSIPTIACGVPNTLRGHCGKTDMILRDFLKRSEMKPSYRWLLIADDDTIMSVARMIKLISCYDPKETVFLGEKYGFSLSSGYGYGYITGGGGMLFSKPTVEAWVAGCKCPSIDTPDDMYLGSCLLADSGIITTHSPLFHQARPEDYADGYLGNQTPVSFHKHWMVDPIKVYKAWFAKADEDLEVFDHTAPTMAPTTMAPDDIPSPLPPTPLEDQIKDEL